jgi:hypothetical protein
MHSESCAPRTDDAERFSLAITGIIGKRLMYKQLIAAADAGVA